MKILVVDDNANNRKLMRLIFEKNGYHDITEARDGLEGFEQAKCMHPDLIVSDALMPRMDGFHFLWAIKMDENLRHTPFVFYSAIYTGLKEEELALRLGAERFITRPKEPDDLWREMSCVLEGISSDRRPPPPFRKLVEEREFLIKYSEVVGDKLKEKVHELEQALACRDTIEAELQKLSLAVEQSPVSIIITDLNGNIEFVNRKFCELTGYSREELIGRNPRILKSGETSTEEYERLWATITCGEPWHGEFLNRKKNGELYRESATISPVKDRDGAITHYMAIKEDITERKRLEEQLLHAQKMEAVGTLAGGIAHDFNNILTAIMGYSYITMAKMQKNDPLLPNIRNIQAAAERAAGLTRSLLSFSRKQMIDMKVIDLNSVVKGMENMLRMLIREDIELNCVLMKEELPVLAERVQLEQVLLNLATNACDAIEKGGVITITTESADFDKKSVEADALVKQGTYAVLSFTDTGMGMDECTRKLIFDPFFTTKEPGKGTGLGLAVSYGIIKQHDGHIECLSQSGNGTTFRMYLPLVQKMAEHLEAAERRTSNGGNETILVAEDDPSTMGAISSILKESGYRVLEATDGVEAVEIYKGKWREIDLCLLDMIMPRKRGCDARLDIRRINRNVKVLLMSGYSADFLPQDHLLEEGFSFIMKPVVGFQLLRKVRDVLDR